MNSGERVAGKYLLEEKLGAGTMGEVFRALHTGTGRRFAIKFMSAEAADAESGRERFLREARVAACVNHPTMVDVFDIGSLEDGSLYLVMELLEGERLEDALTRQPPMTMHAFLSIMRDVAEGLAAAHKAGIVHRDLKPDNILLHREGVSGSQRPKILDFGVGKFVQSQSVATQADALLGSPIYMSPEQTRSAAAVDARSDLWSFGVILFEGLTGQLPYRAENLADLLVEVAQANTLSIDHLAPELPRSVRDIVSDCLKPLERRILRAEELANRLTMVLEDEKIKGMCLVDPLDVEDDMGSRLSALPAAIPPVRPPATTVASFQSSFGPRTYRASSPERKGDFVAMKHTVVMPRVETSAGRRRGVREGRDPRLDEEARAPFVGTPLFNGGSGMQPISMTDVARIEQILRLLAALLLLILGVCATDLLISMASVLLRRAA